MSSYSASYGIKKVRFYRFILGIDVSIFVTEKLVIIQ